ncbi:hypothetical protein F3157_05065 [Virgibacillus dakarensis]|uniref:Uncharacterized protein n=1 Tax=Lentibacillus populi TaxID=1827502 RepID=A0A9W5TWB5_9BACI|nr:MULTISPECIES: hypothetical protein [Bacillaceae]MBT2214351.1 hypothetical protein [Virgibacillus dakarensis]MTW85028.1 hypothetical protein [Virgibacillus dakarensis]GGB34193.1 hypothetical protein GCM10011409_09540 [Lentibacillus populi]
MDKNKGNKKHSKEQLGKVKPYQEINNEITSKNELKQMQPTPQPQDFEEIDY